MPRHPVRIEERIWEFGSRVNIGDPVAIKVYSTEYGTYLCADIVKIIKLTPQQLVTTKSSANQYPTRYWRDRGEAIGARGIQAARPGQYDWELYKRTRR